VLAVTRSPLADLHRPKAVRTAALTMGLLTATGAFAPAALATETTDVTGTPAPPSEDEETSTPSAVLTPDPVPTTTASSPVRAHYGTGKFVGVGITVADALPTGQSLDLTGARVELDFATVNGSESTQGATCEYLTPMVCEFPDGADLPQVGLGSPVTFWTLPENSEFTLTMVTPPRSGQLLVGSSAAVLDAYTTTATDPAAVIPPMMLSLPVPTAHRTLGVRLQGAEPLDGATFELCTVAGSDCAGAGDVTESATTDEDGLATFPGRYLPGTYTVVQTAAAEGGALDPEAHALVVGSATSVTERDTPLREAFGEPVTTAPTTPAPTTTEPSTTSPSTTAPITTEPSSTAPTTTPSTTAPSTTAPSTTAPSTTAPSTTAPSTTAATSTAPGTTAATTSPAGAPTSSVASQTVALGRQQTVVLGGFQPFETVRGTLHSTPVDLGTVRADADGVATFTFDVPAGLEVGSHSVSMTGLVSGTTAELFFTVTGQPAPAAATTAPATTEDLASTGTDALPLLAVGGGLLVAGAAAVTVANRRRSA
jgi:hypothetical protein